MSCKSIRCDVLQDCCQFLTKLIDRSDNNIKIQLRKTYDDLVVFLDQIRPIYCVGVYFIFNFNFIFNIRLIQLLIIFQIT